MNWNLDSPPKKKYGEIRYLHKKKNILESAARLFAKKGYEKATLEEIADELHMTKGSLYYYIKSKEDMLFQCHLRALEEANEVLRRLMQAKMPAELKVFRAITGHVNVVTREFVIGTLRQQEMLLPGHMKEKVIAERDMFQRNFIKIINNGVSRKVFEKKDWKMKVFAILGAINWIPRWYNPGGKLTPAEIGRAMAAYFVKGLIGTKKVVGLGDY